MWQRHISWDKKCLILQKTKTILSGTPNCQISCRSLNFCLIVLYSLLVFQRIKPINVLCSQKCQSDWFVGATVPCLQLAPSYSNSLVCSGILEYLAITTISLIFPPPYIKEMPPWQKQKVFHWRSSPVGCSV